MPGWPSAAFTSVSNDRQIEANAGPIVTEDLIFTSVSWTDNKAQMKRYAAG